MTTADIKKLKDMTGAGIMDCKKALLESNDDFDKAVQYLREKGIAAAAKKATRIAAEGAVGSYIHMGGKIGVLVEVNCETDFVAKTDKFQELVKNLAMHIAAASPEYVQVEDIPTARVEQEKEILLAQMDNDEKLANKPLQVKENIIKGKIENFYKDVCLMNQTYVKNPDLTIKQLIEEATLQIGEKITIRRFARFVMGEGLEKRKDDFAEEVKKQTQGL
ncbi:MAG: translation elongation factor Ts [Clostridia bacterium]|nr:translation elongation factor Ts [Clostridia bacterium]